MAKGPLNYICLFMWDGASNKRSCSKFALESFQIPKNVSDILIQYFGNAFICLITDNYTTGWQALEVAIMMGCVVSPLLFIMCMELILRGNTDTTNGEETRSGGVFLPAKALMDDITTLAQSKSGTQELSGHSWNHMGKNEGQAKVKPKHFPCLWDWLWHLFLHRW